jgi:cytidine deaminase
MKSIEVKSLFSEYDSIEELPESDRQLINHARESVKNAYAPYSHFQVGAAVLLENGKIVLGNNQENASYPLGLCAERVAIFAAASNHPRIRITAIAITALSESFHIDTPIPPCGACRQAIAEYEYRYSHPIRIIMTGEKGNVLIADSIKQFLPFQFTADKLKLKR